MRTELVQNYSSISLASMADTPYNSRPGSLNRDGTVNESNQTLGTSDQLKSTVKNIAAQTFRRKTVEKSFPILKWLPHYNGEKLIADIIAAITVTITMLPQGMAYASIADLPPEVGLYSCFAGCFVHIFFGGAPQIVVGPTAILGILTFTYTDGMPKETAVMLTFLTGAMSLLLGIFKLGFIVNFISKPVNAAFTSAAALTICSTQIKEALGLTVSSQGFLEGVTVVVENIAATKLPDCILSVGSIIVLIFLRQLPIIFGCCCKNKNNESSSCCSWLTSAIRFISISRNAIMVIIPTAVVIVLGDSQPFNIVMDIKSGLPPFAPPPFSVTNTTTNVTYTFTKHILQQGASAIIVMPLLAIMEHMSIAKALAGEKMVDASQEMVSGGLANLVGSFFGSMPVTGSFSLTTVNASSGARTPLSGLFTGSMVLLAISYMTPYFYYIPKASLASVIICAVIFMIDFGIVKSMWNAKKMELIPWALTAIVSLFAGLQFGMMTGFIISVTYLMYYAARPGVKVKRGYTTTSAQFVLIQLDRSLTFPSVEYIRYLITKASKSYGENKLPMVIDCSHIQFADFTAAQGLRDLINTFKKRDQLILLFKAKESVVRILEGVDPAFHVVLTEYELENILDEQGESRIEIQIDGKPHLEHELGNNDDEKENNGINIDCRTVG